MVLFWYSFGMGKVPAPGLAQVKAQIEHDILVRIDQAARAVAQPRSAWLRMAIMEKLERDGR